MPKARLIRIAIASVAGLALAFAIAWWSVEQERARQTDGTQITLVQANSIGGPFELTDHTGRTVTPESFAGKYMLVYFGFTFCPDICPTDLQVMAAALDALGPEAGEQVQPLFVSVDPERDTPSQMAEFVALFHPRLVGLTGTPEQVKQAAASYRAYYAKAPGDDPQSYLMDHSTFTYLMGPDGGFITVFGRGTKPDAIADTIRSHIAALARG